MARTESVKVISIDDLPFNDVPYENISRVYKELTYFSVPKEGANCAFAGVAIWAGTFATNPNELAAKVRLCVTKFIQENYSEEVELLEQLRAGGTVDKSVFKYISRWQFSTTVQGQS